MVHNYIQTYLSRDVARLFPGLNFQNFIEEQNCPMGIVINNDEHPRLYHDRIVGVPFACL